MASLNKVLLIGRLGQDPEKRVTPSGASVVNVSLATSDRFKDKTGNQQERTEWHRLVFWNRTAEIVEQYCRKGSQLYIEGTLQTRDWQDKDGNKKYTTEIMVRNMQMLDSKGSQQQSDGGGTYFQGQNPPQQQQGGFNAQPQQQQGGFNAQPQQQQGGQFNGGFQNNNSGGAQSFQTPPSPPPHVAAVDDDFIEDDIPF